MALFSKILNKFRGGSVSAADWDEFESALIESDLGGKLAHEIIAVAKSGRPDDIEAELLESLRTKMSEAPRTLEIHSGRTTTILVVGVNGTGKTTSVAKLMKYFKDQQLSVVVAAADTFRAAAIDQIQTWGTRLGVPVVVGKSEGDPAAVAFDGIKHALDEHADLFIVDTAGRLHTKSGLMDELAKIRRVVEKASPIDEVLLVVDATTGQNGITQAKLFAESVAVTGLILTKMDGSAKGGVALAIEAETGIPVKFIGMGESAQDLAAFDAEKYLKGLLS
ncbi:MAG: signal recognition particle-docking protein FtsY [Actinomycetes bacterium]